MCCSKSHSRHYNHCHHSKHCCSCSNEHDVSPTSHSCCDNSDDSGGDFSKCSDHSDHDTNSHCSCGHSHKKVSLKRLIVALSIFLLTFFTNHELIRSVLYISSYLIVSYDVIKLAIKNIVKGRIFDENFLMSIASIGAFFIHEEIEAVIVMLLFRLGELLEEYAENKSRRSIKSLLNIRPETANIVTGDNILEVNAKEVKVGDLILVRPGERIPLDGILTESNVFADTSAMTGESIPKLYSKGELMLSGSIVLERTCVLRVSEDYKNSTVTRVIEMVENATKNKAKSERFISKFASIYTPVVLILALLLMVIPTIVFGVDSFSQWFYRALTFLVISCPCALVLSIPLTFFAAIGGAARKGVLIKGGSHLEKLSRVRQIVFDKTGTLTTGTFTIRNIVTNTLDEISFLSLAASAQQYSSHPISQAICKTAKLRECHIQKAESFEEFTGLGVSAKVNGRTIHVGNIRLMEKVGVSVDIVNDAGAVVYVAENSKYLGYINLIDAPKSNAKNCINSLKKLGILRTIMLSGDKNSVAEEIGKEIEIDIIKSELLPDDKLREYKNLSRNSVSAYVGDGINDAPVLVEADVGIAMGMLGSDVAIDSADIVLTNDDLSSLVFAVKHSKRVMRIVKENIIGIIGIKVLCMVCGALGIGGMWIAVAADVGTTLMAVINSMRALNK